jgi:hypothetical protein
MNIATLIFGTISSCGTIIGIIVVLRTLRAVDNVHSMVNQQRTDAQTYQEDLIVALQEAGINIPPDKSLH